MVVYTAANITVFRNARPEVAGTVGAVFNSALQLGGAIGTAVFTSIQTSIDDKKRKQLGFSKEDPAYTRYDGRKAGWWFIAAFVGVAFVGVLVFYRRNEEVVSGEIDAVGGIEQAAAQQEAKGDLEKDPARAA